MSLITQAVQTVVMDTDIEGQDETIWTITKSHDALVISRCSALDVISILNKMNEEIDDFKIEVSGELTDEHPKYYQTVDLEYHFYGADLNQKKCQRAVDLSYRKILWCYGNVSAIC